MLVLSDDLGGAVPVRENDVVKPIHVFGVDHVNLFNIVLRGQSHRTCGSTSLYGLAIVHDDFNIAHFHVALRVVDVLDAYLLEFGN